MGSFSLSDLETIISARAGEDADASYTASLLGKGVEKCAEKFGEEAIEAIIAAVAKNGPGLVNETADVLFHLLVLLKASDITLEEVMQELKRRTGQSGHSEKASRQGH
ncbi:MAG: phosphoribosyl-ATP diphosphatase [Pseudomonadota bacterium]